MSRDKRINSLFRDFRYKRMRYIPLDHFQVENKWLSDLEKKLESNASQKAIDGEQIAEELDNLDRYLSKKNVENRMKINDLAEDIVSNNMMVSQITAELDKFNEKTDDLEERGKERIKTLEDAIKLMQDIEREIQVKLGWIPDQQTRLPLGSGSEGTFSPFPGLSQHFNHF